jgi:hypothetical protein
VEHWTRCRNGGAPFTPTIYCDNSYSRHRPYRTPSPCAIVFHYRLLLTAHALKHLTLLLTHPPFTLHHRSRKRRANIKQHILSGSRILFDSSLNMYATYRITHPCASARFSLSFHAHAVQAPYSPSPPQQPVDPTLPPVTDETRNYIAAFGEYDDSSQQPRKKRRVDNNFDTGTRKHVPKTIAAADCKMINLVGIAKLHEPSTPPTSPPDLKNAILRTGPQPRSASPSTESASVSPPFSPSSAAVDSATYASRHSTVSSVLYEFSEKQDKGDE